MAAAVIGTHNGTSTFSVQDPQACILCGIQNKPLKDLHCPSCQNIVAESKEAAAFMHKLVSTWECPRCTLCNKIEHEVCSACGLSKLSLHPEEKVLINSGLPAALKFASMTVRTRRHKDESHAEQVYQNIVKYCRQNKTNFVDDRFRPSDHSIGSGSFDSVKKWLRISEVAPLSDADRKLDWTIFSSPQPSDIQQGALGNCWLVAALALVSERPHLLDHILLTKNVNKEGVYLVRICHNGLWQTTILDDYFPCTKHNHLVFTQAKRHQLYVPLIEKACAKVFGSYANLRSGNMREGLQLLTGASCDYIDLKSNDHAFNSDLAWSRLLSACEADLLIGASSGVPNISPEEYAQVHIHGNHAFSLLTATKLSVQPHRFVLLRDPHSRSNYNEESINGSVLQQLNAIKKADRSTGAFWISWPRFLRYFSSVTISTYKSDYFDIRECGKFTQSSTDYVTSYRINVPTNSFVMISVLYHRQNRATHNNHTQAFVLCDVDDSKKTQNIGQRESFIECQRGGFVYWSGSLQAGVYDIIPFSTSFWRNNDKDKSRSFTLVIQSSVDLGLSMKKKPSTYLADCLIPAAMKVSSHHKQEKDVVFRITRSKLGMKLFIAENFSTTRYLNVDIDMKVARNVRHSRHAHLPFKTHDCIPPWHRQLIFITEWADKHGQSAQLNYTYSHGFDSEKSHPKPSIDISHGDIHSPRKI